VVHKCRPPILVRRYLEYCPVYHVRSGIRPLGQIFNPVDHANDLFHAGPDLCPQEKCGPVVRGQLEKKERRAVPDQLVVFHARDVYHRVCHASSLFSTAQNGRNMYPDSSAILC